MNSNNNVQITLTREMVDRKIDLFASGKRENIDSSNQNEFHPIEIAQSGTCARLDAPHIDRTTQIKTSKVHNTVGPLVIERLKNLEEFLEPPLPLASEILQRIKNLEDRALALERAGELPYQQLSYKISERGENKRKATSLILNEPTKKLEIYSLETFDPAIETLKERLEQKLKQKKKNEDVNVYMFIPERFCNRHNC